MGTAAETVCAMVATQDAGDTAGYAASFAPDGEFVHPAATVRGREELAQFIGGYHTAFPDGSHEITRLVEAGDVVAMEGTWTGTQTGALPTPDGGQIPPTGRTVTIRWAGFAQLADGQIVSLHGYYDQGAFMAQLGLVPQPA